MTIKALETKYKGYRFRSRLEARWAVLFDALGLGWEYEPQGYDLGDGLGCYLPDFFLTQNRHYGPYIEIKGQRPTDLEVRKLEVLCLDKCAYGLVIFGQVGDQNYIAIHKEAGAYSDENTLHSHFGIFDEFQWVNAVIAARSARFEHGEVPA